MELTEIEPQLTYLKQEIAKLSNQLNVQKKDEEEILTTNTACDFLHVNRQRIDTWRNTGILPSIQVGNRWLYRKSDLVKLFDEWNGLDLSDEASIEFSRLVRDKKKRTC